MQTKNLKTMRKTLQTVRRIGLQLVAERSGNVVNNDNSEEKDTLEFGIEKGEKKRNSRNDLLSVLSMSSLSVLPGLIFRQSIIIIVRANHASHPSQRLSTEEILCQISTFITAGHETTSSAITWCLYALAKDAREKKKKNEKTILENLRKELKTLPRVDDLDELKHNGSGEEFEHNGDIVNGEHSADRGRDETALDRLTSKLSSLPYLDSITRESLRLHPPATNTMRICNVERDLIPLSRGKEAPLKSNSNSIFSSGSVSLSNNLMGDTHTRSRRSDVIEVRKGDIICISVSAVNTMVGVDEEDGWGEDAMVFKFEFSSTYLVHYFSLIYIWKNLQT